MMGGGQGRILSLWVYLHTQPLLWLSATLAAYVLGASLHARANFAPAVNAVAIAVALLVGTLLATHTSYATYFEGAQFVHFLLGPATVALAIPLFRNRHIVARAILPITAALAAGSFTAVVSAMGVAWVLGGTHATILSLAPKSVTTPIAMGISERIGGTPSLTAIMVILTGIFGAIVARPVLNFCRVFDWRARGFAIGVAAHGLGTARAFQVDQLAGTFAGIAVGLNGITTSLLVPVLVELFRQ